MTTSSHTPHGTIPTTSADTTELGLPCEIRNHASYLQFWLGKLREDKREIFRAAAAAQRIADYCLAFHPDYRTDVYEDAAREDPSGNEQADTIALAA